jgi:hypothetical protein
MEFPPRRPASIRAEVLSQHPDAADSLIATPTLEQAMQEVPKPERILDLGAGEARALQLRLTFPEAVVVASPPSELRPQEPFDLIFVQPDPAGETLSATVRIAASMLSAAGAILCEGALGPHGASLRGAVMEVLRFQPDFSFTHPTVGEGRDGGVVRRRTAGGGRRATAGDAQRRRLAAAAAIVLAGRPVLELATSAPLLGAAQRERGLAARTLKLTRPDWSARDHDAMIEVILDALALVDGSILFSADLLDEAPDAFVMRLFERLAAARTSALLLSTPPGEEDAAGPCSRPASRIVDMAAAHGLKAFAAGEYEFERARHGEAPLDETPTTRGATALLLALEGGWRPRSAGELSAGAASAREQLEVQRAIETASLRLAARRQAAAAAAAAAALGEAEELAASHRERAAAAKAAQRAAEADAEGRIAEARAELERLKPQLAEREAKAGEALARVGALEAELENWDARFERLLSPLLRDMELARERERQREDAWRAEKDLHLEEIESLRTAERALRAELDARKAEASLAVERAARAEADFAAAETERARLAQAEAARGSQLAALEASTAARLHAAEDELAHLRRAKEEVEADAARLRDQLAAENLRIVAAACREADLRSRLEGVSAHLRMAGQSLEAYRTNPETYARLDLVYAPPPESEASANIELLAAALHGRAADHASELARTLEDAVQRGREAREAGSLQSVASEAAHAAALEEARTESAREVRRLEALAETALARAAALRRQAGAAEPEADGLGVSERLLAELRALEDRLAHLASVSAADGGAAPRSLSDAGDVTAAPAAQEADPVIDTAEPAPPFEALPAVEKAEPAGPPGAPAAPALEPASETAPEASPAAPSVIEYARLKGQPKPVRIWRSLTGDGAGGSSPAETGKVIPLTPAPPEERPAQPVAAPQLDPTVPPQPQPSAPALQPSPVPQIEPASAGASPSTGASSAAAKTEADDGAARLNVRGVGGRLVERAVERARQLWRWARAYPETTELIRLQRALTRELTPYGLKPRVFDAKHYMAGKPDLRGMSPLTHYLLVGEETGRSPLAGFDPYYYSASLPPGTSYRGSALRHFLTTGLSLGYSPSEQLDPLPQIAAGAGMRPLEFFFRWQAAHNSSGEAGVADLNDD